jgi:hypothetical protein
MAKPRVIAFLIKEFRELIPPTLFFLVGFNVIVLTTQLILSGYLHDYFTGLANFMIATTSALVVGKAVLVANHMPLLRRYDTAPLIQPILYKTVVYCLLVFLVRLLERVIRYFAEGGTLAGIPDYVTAHFSWDRFTAVQIWIFVLFLIYTTFHELNELFGQGELYKILFKRRSSELKLSRRQRIRTLVRLNDLTIAHGVAELRDPKSAAHAELVGLLQSLVAKNSRPALRTH